MRITKLFFVAMLLCAAPAAWASSVVYYVTADTSLISGSTGFLDFQFNPGPYTLNPAAPATADLLAYSSDGTLDLSGLVTSGDVSGNLPGTVTFDNGNGLSALNDYSPNFTFGLSIYFQVILSWTQPSSPPDSGSAFVFYMYQNNPGQYVAGSSSPDGRAFDLNINADGTTLVNNYSGGSGAPVTISTTPEPGSLLLMFAPVLVLCGWRLRSCR